MINSFIYEERMFCICGSPLSKNNGVIRKNFAWGEVQFVQCKACSSWCQSPNISGTAQKRWYDSDEYQGSHGNSGIGYVNYLGDEKNRRNEALIRYQRDLKKYLQGKSKKVLEIGCATGSLLSAIRDAGHEITGIDLSYRFAEAAKDFYNIEVQVADIIDANLPENYYDIVIMFGTISNLHKIVESLKRIYKLLKPSGVLILNHPSADSVIASIYGNNFWMYTPSVDTFMTRKGLHLALEQAGLHLSEYRTDVQMPSFEKLFKLSGLNLFFPLLRLFGLSGKSFPLPLPVPGVKFAQAIRI